MIELLVEEKCVECNQCVKVCPVNVFEARDNQVPIIARQSECQTCYMCELYCPVNALYVGPNAEESEEISPHEIEEKELLGSYRKNVGWEKGQKSTASDDLFYKFYLR
ncbi:ferredoxin family protein [Bacillus sp. DNRA2]|uniref:4Fe-4S dicluster domain-containing protein n=1 Tax=Bacillus sp. DNRA2 TaxID=2723053 RepID=UPI00145D7215|nr:ferredoxin family protein [Bacillus sp. DNRA2]NMD70934.1 ferredoxin family protein [Bacillus sp. DNRA2]